MNIKARPFPGRAGAISRGPRVVRQAVGTETTGGGLGGSGAVSGRELVVFAGAHDTSDAFLAAAWFTLLADPRKVSAVLGSSTRGPARLPPSMVEAMREVGADSKTVQIRSLTAPLLAAADLVITLGASFDRLSLRTDKPLYREHWQVAVDDASSDGRPGRLARVRAIRDLIRARVAMLLFSEGWVRPDISPAQAHVTRPRWHGQGAPAF